MPALEHRVPPPVVMLLTAVLMWILAFLPGSWLGSGHWLLAAVFAVPAAAFAASGIRAFGRAGTTVNPVRIDAASTLVTTGIYGRTRNPMYVGLALLLCAWAAALASPWAALGPVLFVAFITRFQIIPEERVLLEKFGPPYAEYCRYVRRWL